VRVAAGELKRKLMNRLLRSRIGVGGAEPNSVALKREETAASPRGNEPAAEVWTISSRC
jgi:hypothetical protein